MEFKKKQNTHISLRQIPKLSFSFLETQMGSQLQVSTYRHIHTQISDYITKLRLNVPNNLLQGCVI